MARTPLSEQRAGVTRPARSVLLGPPILIAIVVLALAVTALGAVRLVDAFGAQPTHRPDTAAATLGDLSTQVSSAKWIGMDHGPGKDEPGYQMPEAMMPNMPQGQDQRLSVTITITNNSDQTRPLRANKEFTLRVRGGERQLTPYSDTFGDLPRLPPHNAVTGTLFFDLPPADVADSSGWLEWSHDGAAAGLAIPLNGAAPPEHPHG